MSKMRDRMSMSVYDPSGAGSFLVNDISKLRKNTDRSSQMKSTTNYSDIELDLDEIDEDEEYIPQRTSTIAKSSKLVNKSMIELDPENYKEELSNLKQDQIFFHFCERTAFKEDDQCKICRAKFSILKKRKHCKFCGESVCDDHSKKKRPNPQNQNDKSDVQRICDECDFKYIKHKVLEKNYAKNIEVDKEITNVQGNITLEQKKIASLKEKISEIEKQEKADNVAHIQNINYLNSEKSRKEAEMKTLDAQLTTNRKEYDKVKEELTKVKQIYAQVKEEYENMKNDAVEYNYKIEAKRLDIDVVNRQIKQIEELLNRNKPDTSEIVAESLLGLNESIMGNAESFISERRTTMPSKNSRKLSKVSRAESEALPRTGGCNIECNIF